ncbi:thioredoxin domain-containing protein [Gimesia sp.]|nr:thioredoxin domain-containing protein [Gimesia sp.]
MAKKDTIMSTNTEKRGITCTVSGVLNMVFPRKSAPSVVPNSPLISRKRETGAKNINVPIRSASSTILNWKKNSLLNMKPSSEKNHLRARINKIRQQMKAEVQQRDSQVTRPISGGLPVPFYAVALLVCALTSGCQNTASDLSLSSLPEVTDLDFQQTVLEADQPVLVEFWAPWCRPCVEMTPILEQVSKQYAGRVKILRIRIDDNPATAAEYEIDSPPAFILFRERTVFKRRLGKQSQLQLTGLLSSSLPEEIIE